MSTERIADMTHQELEAFVIAVIDKKIRTWSPITLGKPDPVLWQAIIDDIIPADPDIPSPTEMLREERDQWYKPYLA